METELISVIIPVYNVEKYLSKCIRSILKQTYRNLEIILVNNGSTDKSGSICDTYAKNDKRISVFYTENAGVGEARNTGIKRASGKYICFVDSDDFLPLDSIEKLYQGMRGGYTDLCCGAWARIAARRTSYNHYEAEEVSVDDKKRLANYLEIDEVNGPVAKLYRKDIIDTFSLRFPHDVLIGEDAIFNYQYIQHCHTVSIIDSTVYFYNNLNGTSATHTFYDGFNRYSIMITKEEIRNILCDEYPLESVLVQKIICSRLMRNLNYVMFFNLSEEKTCSWMRCTLKMFKPYLSIGTILSEPGEFGEFALFAHLLRKNDVEGIYTCLRNGQNVKKNCCERAKCIYFKALNRIRVLFIYGR